jgi:oligoendopeptidase F
MPHRVVSILVLAVTCGLAAQQGAADLPLETARLSPTLYFPNDAGELSGRQALHAQVDTQVKALPTTDAASLVQVLNTAWTTIGALQRHAAYLRVQTLEDTQNDAAKDGYSAVTADQSVLQTAIDDRLRLVKTDEIPALGPYARLASRLQGDTARAFPLEAARYRSRVTRPHERALADAFDALISSIPRTSGTNAPDPATRRAALAARDTAYDGAAPAAAAFIGAVVDAENRDAIAQGFANAAERQYRSLELTDNIVNQTLAAVAAQAGAYRAYQKVLAAHVTATLGVSAVLSTERDLGAVRPIDIPSNEGRRLILDALQPLGRDYVDRFAALLDPANGRLDLTGGAHRARTATSVAVYDGPVALYVSSYSGTLASLSAIAHEGGHAIHRELMNASGSPLYQRNGPHDLMEGFALFNELLLYDHAAKIADTPSARTYALEHLLSTITFELFGSAEETVFERSLYTTTAGRAPLNRAQIDELYQAAIAPYESWSMSDVGRSRAWMQKPLLVEDPLYLVNYLYAAVVAVELLDRSSIDPDFAQKYTALLRRGFDADASTLLATVGIARDDPKLIEAVAKFIEAKTAELQRLYHAG